MFQVPTEYIIYNNDDKESVYKNFIAPGAGTLVLECDHFSHRAKMLGFF